MTEPGTAVDTVDKVSGEVIDADFGPPMRWSEREWPLEFMGAFLDALSTLPVVSSAARTARVSRPWVYVCANRYPEFAEAWQEALAQGVEVLEQHVVRWATVGINRRETVTKTLPDGKVEVTVKESTDVSASLAAFVLKRHKPEYRERYGIEHTGADGGPIEVSLRERMNEAVERFDARVVRLASVGAAGAAADGASG